MWIDTHAHLNDSRFDYIAAEVVDRAVASGVERILVIGIDVPSSMRALQIAERFDPVVAVVGIQPNSLGSIEKGDWERIVELATRPKVVALGETGLDNYWKSVPLDLQEEYFQRHLRLCNERDLPIVIHCREAERDVVRCLQQHRETTGKPIRGVMHSFTGDRATAAQCLSFGLHISFAGMVTFKKSNALREVAQSIPLNRLLVETDSPYLAPHPLRGKPNEPAYVVHTGACLAQVHGIGIDQLAQATTQNAIDLFRLPLNRREQKALSTDDPVSTMTSK